MLRGLTDLSTSVFNIGNFGASKVNLEIINNWIKREKFGNLVIIKLEISYAIRKGSDILRAIQFISPVITQSKLTEWNVVLSILGI